MVHPKILEVIEYDVCTACGACEAVCPANAVIVDITAAIRDPDDLSLYKKGAAPNVCEGCFTCGRVCPVVDGYAEDEFANVKRFFAAKSELPGQDGGMASAIVKSLFEKGEIDCAVGITMNEKWETEVIVLTQAGDVDKTKGTKYTSDPVDAILKDLFKTHSKIAVVGVPCQVHAANLIRENVNDKIAVIIGLLCMESFHHDKMQEEIIPNILGLNIEDVVKMDFGGGKFWAYTRDGGEHNVPIAEIASLARNPCHNCCDYTSVHADISVGSVGAPDGWNSVMIRTDVGEKYINMVDGLEINDDPKPGMFLIKKLTEMKHKNNSGHYLEVCEKFSFDECGMH